MNQFMYHKLILFIKRIVKMAKMNRFTVLESQIRLSTSTNCVDPISLSLSRSAKWTDGQSVETILETTIFHLQQHRQRERVLESSNAQICGPGFLDGLKTDIQRGFLVFWREQSWSTRLDGKNRWSGDAPIICLRRRSRSRSPSQRIS